MSKIPLVHQRLSALLARSRAEARVVVLAACYALLAACGGGGGGGDGNSPPPTGTLQATVVDEFDAPVSGAAVAVTVGTTTRNGTTDSSGIASVGNVPTGTASVDISLETFQSQTVSNVNITANQTTAISVTLVRNTQAAGGAVTSEVTATAPDGSSITFKVKVVVVDSNSDAILNLTSADFALQDCTPSATVRCMRIPGTGTDQAYTADNATPAPLTTEPAAPNADFAAAVTMDQSGSVGNVSDPTGARLFSAKAFLQSVDAASNDQALLAAFADDRSNQTALIPDKPLTIYGTAPYFTSGERLYFDQLDGLATQAGGGTPLYRSLFPEATDNANDPAFTKGLIDIVAENAPGTLRKAIVLFTDGQDEECGGAADPCPAKRQRVIDHANAANVEIFTIGLSNDVDFEALTGLADGTGGSFLFAETAEQLIPLYGSLGELLSGSLLTYVGTWTITAAPGTFSSGTFVLGRIQVDAGTSPIQVPFVVGVP